MKNLVIPFFFAFSALALIEADEIDNNSTTTTTTSPTTPSTNATNSTSTTDGLISRLDDAIKDAIDKTVDNFVDKNKNSFNEIFHINQLVGKAAAKGKWDLIFHNLHKFIHISSLVDDHCCYNQCILHTKGQDCDLHNPCDCSDYLE